MPGNRMKTKIEQKINPAIVIAVSLILGALGTYTYLTAKSRLLVLVFQAIEATVGRLSTSLISPLWELNNTDAQEFVTAEMRSREIFSVVVRDNKNGLFAAKTRNTAGEIVVFFVVFLVFLFLCLCVVLFVGVFFGSFVLFF